MFFTNGRKGYNKWWMYALGIFMVLFGYMLGQIPLMLITQSYLEKYKPSQGMEEFFANPDFSSIGMSNNLGLCLLLLMFVVAFIALYLVVTQVHKKRFSDLVHTGGSFSWARVMYGFGLWMVLLAMVELGVYFMDPTSYMFTFNYKAFIPLLLICLVILPIQTSFEEVFFRGYLLQGLHLLVQNKFFVIIMTSLLFMGVHSTNPEIQTFGFSIMMAYYFSAGLLLAIVTTLDNRLELALGMHAAMNLFGAVFVGYEGGVLQTDSVWKATQINPNFMLIGLIISGLLFIAISYKKFSWNIDRLFSNPHIENNVDVEEQLLSNSNF